MIIKQVPYRTNPRNGDLTVVIADDHSIVRQGTKFILELLDNVSVVAEAADGLVAIAAVKKHKPTMLVLDAAMPHARGIEVLAEARRWSPSTRIILLTGFTSLSLLSDWLDAGVDGLLLKNSEQMEMKLAFETVLNGGTFVAAEVREMLENSQNSSQLTNREREVLAMIAKGRTNTEIGDRLSISVKTVEKHRASLMQKLEVHSVAELMVHALREGLLDEFRQL